jgi:hypothetical protein
MGTGVQKFEELQEFKEESVSDRQPWSVAFPRPRDEAKGSGDSPESHVRRFVHSPIPGTGDLAASQARQRSDDDCAFRSLIFN